MSSKPQRSSSLSSSSSSAYHPASAMPPRASTRSSFSSSVGSSNNGSGNGRHRSPSPQQQSTTTNSRRPYGSFTSGTSTTTNGSGGGTANNSVSSVLSNLKFGRSSSPGGSGSHSRNGSSSSIGIGTANGSVVSKHKPWHNHDELDVMPTRHIQNQTGGAARTSRSAVNVDLSLQGAAYPVPTKPSSRSSSLGAPDDDDYDKYGFSDCYPRNSQSTNTTSTATTTSSDTSATAPPREDAYARYLQQKEKSAIDNNNPTTGRPPIRSRSPSVERYYMAQTKSTDSESFEEDSAITNARNMRAKRLAQQKVQSKDNDLRLQSHNPAVQAYLARKEKEREQQGVNVKTNTSSHSKPSNYYDSLLLSRKNGGGGSSTSLDDSSKEEKQDEPSYSTRRHQQQQQHSMQHPHHQQPPPRPPPAPPQQPKAVQVQSNMTTYTYQFQPQKSDDVAADTSVTRARRLLQSSSNPNNASALKDSTEAMMRTSLPDLPSSASKPIVPTTRRSAPPTFLMDNNNATSSNPTTGSITTSSLDYMYHGNKAAALHSRNNSASSAASMSSSTGATKQQQQQSKPPQSQYPTRTTSAPSANNNTTKTSIPYGRSNSSPGYSASAFDSEKGPIPRTTATTTTTNTAVLDPPRIQRKTSDPTAKSSLGDDPTAKDCSVTRARRLLSEGRERQYSAFAPASTSSLMTTASEFSQSSLASSSSSAAASRPRSVATRSSSTGTAAPNPVDLRSSRRTASAGGEATASSAINLDHSNNSNNALTTTVPRPQMSSIPANLENDDWSVRVCVISAVDFPVHVVPNMPLSPVLKVGLVSLQEAALGKERLLREIDRKGLGAVSEQMRCTTTKLLSKRDNGAVEFHEELRWDHVALKGNNNNSNNNDSCLALAVELCARGVLRPANLHESPPPALISPSKGGGGGTSGFSPLRSRAVTPSPGGRRSPESLQDVNSSTTSNASATTRGGRIVNMFRKSGRKGKTDATAMESAQAAAAVAKLLVEGSTSPMTQGRDMASTASATSAPPPPMTQGRSSSTTTAPAPQEWDVTLRKVPETSSGVVMTDDIRLGSLIIPLTELEDLQRVLRDRSQPARLEKWFEVQNMNAAIMNANNPTNPAASARQWLSRGGGDRGDGANSAPGSRSQSPNFSSSARARRNPSILLELSLYAPEVLDDSEDEMDDDEDEDEAESMPRQIPVTKSFAKRTTMQVRHQLQLQSRNAATSAANNSKSPARDSRDEAKQAAQAGSQDPVLEPGIIDFISIVGARDIGDQKQDDGSKGWVQSTPECCVLEQFPPTDDFHLQQNPNRPAVLPQKVEWFCFPDGVKLWRGTQPPSASDFLSQQQQLQASPIMTPSQIMVSEAESTSLALFDAYLNCTTSFNWFVIASNSEEYGSHTQKTYGAVIRFYVPAPMGIDPTQDDFAQTLMGGGRGDEDDEESDMWLEQEQEQPRGLFGAKGPKKEKKRLWVPVGICVTSSLPIVGIMEAVLMRCCEMLASRPRIVPSQKNKIHSMIQRHLANLILNYQQPTAGAVNCSVPFLLGEPVQVRLPPRSGLPPLPHGNAVASVCRLLGPEGFIFVLAALLTESKILLHSHNPANCAMVAEVMTALIYPFCWSLPYIPVLPMGMLEFIEAPLSYLLGIPSSCLELNMVDPMVLEDVVVVDLDTGFSSPDWKTTTTKYKSPTPLPSLVASNISRAVYRLLRALENEHEFGERNSHPVSNASDRLPRIQPESKAEREFRIAIALEMGGLVRGYQDCLVFVSTSQPVFNREKFLKRAPALFIEEPSGGAIGSRANKVKTNRRILSSRSKRFLSILVNCQHFHQFLEMLRTEECSFFHEVMEMWIKGDENNKNNEGSVFESSSSFDHTRAIAQLSKSLQTLEDKVSTFEVNQIHSTKPNGSTPEDDVLQDEDYQVLSRECRFPRNLLQQIDLGTSDDDKDSDVMSVASKSSQKQQGVHHASLSVQYLVELEKNPWRYRNVLDISVPKSEGEAAPVSEVIAGNQSVLVREKVKLRDALGDRKYRAWKLARDQIGEDADISGGNTMEDSLMKPGDFGTSLDLASLMTSATEDTFSETSSQSSLANASMSSRGAATNPRSSLTPEQQRVANAKDRDVLRRCLEKAYAAKPSQQQDSQAMSDIFTHHGRDLVAEAEVALRNPSAQHFLLSLLSKRSKLDEKQKQLSSNDRRPTRRMSNSNSISSSRLEPIAFECVVRLCCAMLDSCMETKDYEPAYLLLCHTAGLFTLQSDNLADSSLDDDGNAAETTASLQPMYMTARIGLHPLFADLGLWQKVMSLHLAEKQANLTTSDRVGSERISGASEGSLSRSESFENDMPGSSTDDEKGYEAAVATLYEMLGYGIPAEELARFATKVSQTHGWFGPGSEKGQSLLLLARRLSMRRELAENGGVAPGETGDLDIMRNRTNTEDSKEIERDLIESSRVEDEDDESDYETLEVGWCHPAAPSAATAAAGGKGPATIATSAASSGMQTEYMNRSAVTALATFGPSVVVSGGLDGGVFLAHTAPRTEDDGVDLSTSAHPNVVVRGIHLDWGSSGSRAIPGSTVVSSADGEYGVGAVSCLAAATGAGGHHHRTRTTSHAAKDVLGLMDDEDMIREMEDSRVIAGTTCGDLRIWSVKDVYAAIHVAQSGDDSHGGGDTQRTSHAGEATSSFIPATPTRRRLGGSTTNDPGTGGGGSNNPFNRLKFSLRGRALSGHRGGVTCVDVPSHVYRPDSVVTGGADGLIKLWSLRTSTVGRRDHTSFLTGASSTSAGQLGRRLAANRGGDALSVLSGHGGRILCVRTAWHGDRLLSGGADRTIRIWDMMSGGNSGAGASNSGDAACLHTLSGHFGWVTHVQYWGPNTIVSGSTDRSIALWDARVRNSPLFVLRHHHAPISDILVGSRTDPLMVSAASDGTVTTWDFRSLSGAAASHQNETNGSETADTQAGSSKHCKVVRHPAAIMSLGPDQDRFSLAKSGPVVLARGDRRHTKTVLSAGSDAMMREWDVSTGRLVKEWHSGHCDALSSLTSLATASSNSLLGIGSEPEGPSSVGGTITSSWDGTIRMRKRIPR